MKLLITFVIVLTFSSLIIYGNVIPNDYNIITNASNICANKTLILRFSSLTTIDKYFIASPTVTCIDIKGIVTIKEGTFDNVPNLKYLDLRENNIYPADFFSFGNLSNLEILRFGYQKGTSNWIENRKIVIRNVYPELRYLDLEYANISALYSEVYNPFPKLTHLYISGNMIQSISLNNILPDTLTYLNLSNNRISEFLFEGLNNLLSLILDNNKISRMGSDITLYGLNALQNLSLANNQISVFNNNTFQCVPNLRYLNLRNTSSTFNFNILKPLKFLETLILDNNLLENIPISIPLNITTLSLNCNKLRNLTYDTFINVPNLRKLHISRNMISNINVDTFETQKLLEELYLDDNYLSFLPRNWCEFMKKLRYLNLSGNKFTSLEMVIYSSTLPIEQLYLERNPIQSINMSSILQIIPKNMTIYLKIDSETNRSSCMPSIPTETTNLPLTSTFTEENYPTSTKYTTPLWQSRFFSVTKDTKLH